MTAGRKPAQPDSWQTRIERTLLDYWREAPARDDDDADRQARAARDLVIAAIRRGESPRDEDVAAALRTAPGESVPADVREYVAGLLDGTVRRSRRPHTSPSVWRDIEILAVYRSQLEHFKAAPRPTLRGEVKAAPARARLATARRCRVSVSTVDQVFAAAIRRYGGTLADQLTIKPADDGLSREEEPKRYRATPEEEAERLRALPCRQCGRPTLNAPDPICEACSGVH